MEKGLVTQFSKKDSSSDKSVIWDDKTNTVILNTVKNLVTAMFIRNKR